MRHRGFVSRARQAIRRAARRRGSASRLVWAVGLLATLLSGCGARSASAPSATPSGTRIISSPSASPGASPGASPSVPAGSAHARGAGINVEPSYRPWRYVGGPAPESWWCVPPNCAVQAQPQERIDTDLQLARALGVNHVRIEFPWRFIEPQRGVYDWARADLIVSQANAYHVTLQPIAVWSPAWVGTPNSAPAPDDFRAFMMAVVGRYHTSISTWELWNEPDLTKYWSDGVRAYTNDILIPGYQGVKAADPTALVMLGGPSWASGDWLNGIYANGGGNSFDIMAWHAYGDVNSVLGSVDNVLPILADHNQADKPLWIGEFGLEDDSTTSGAQSALLRGVLRADSPIAQADWYTLRDEDAMTCCPPQTVVSGTYGLVQRNGVTLKAGYTTLQRLISAGLPAVRAAQ